MKDTRLMTAVRIATFNLENFDETAELHRFTDPAEAAASAILGQLRAALGG